MGVTLSILTGLRYVISQCEKQSIDLQCLTTESQFCLYLLSLQYTMQNPFSTVVVNLLLPGNLVPQFHCVRNLSFPLCPNTCNLPPCFPALSPFSSTFLKEILVSFPAGLDFFLLKNLIVFFGTFL